jgi:hypothetical protein
MGQNREGGVGTLVGGGPGLDSALITTYRIEVRRTRLGARHLQRTRLLSGALRHLNPAPGRTPAIRNETCNRKAFFDRRTGPHLAQRPACPVDAHQRRCESTSLFIFAKVIDCGVSLHHESRLNLRFGCWRKVHQSLLRSQRSLGKVRACSARPATSSGLSRRYRATSAS